MPEFVKVASKTELAPGECKIAEANGKTIAIYNVDGSFYATDNTCIHQGGPLGQGVLQGSVVTCPWHAWQYDVTTGKSVFNPTLGVPTFPVKIEGESILVEV